MPLQDHFHVWKASCRGFLWFQEGYSRILIQGERTMEQSVTQGAKKKFLHFPNKVRNFAPAYFKA